MYTVSKPTLHAVGVGLVVWDPLVWDSALVEVGVATVVLGVATPGSPELEAAGSSAELEYTGSLLRGSVVLLRYPLGALGETVGSEEG